MPQASCTNSSSSCSFQTKILSQNILWESWKMRFISLSWLWSLPGRFWWIPANGQQGLLHNLFMKLFGKSPPVQDWSQLFGQEKLISMIRQEPGQGWIFLTICGYSIREKFPCLAHFGKSLLFGGFTSVLYYVSCIKQTTYFISGKFSTRKNVSAQVDLFRTFQIFMSSTMCYFTNLFVLKDASLWYYHVYVVKTPT